MANIIRSIIGVWAILLLTTPLYARQSTPLTAQQRMQKAQSAEDALTKALRAQGYTVRRVGPGAKITPAFTLPKGITCTQKCFFLPPACTVVCHLM
jgi:hypothetical protein